MTTVPHSSLPAPLRNVGKPSVWLLFRPLRNMGRLGRLGNLKAEKSGARFGKQASERTSTHRVISKAGLLLIKHNTDLIDNTMKTHCTISTRRQPACFGGIVRPPTQLWNCPYRILQTTFKYLQILLIFEIKTRNGRRDGVLPIHHTVSPNGCISPT